MLGSNFKFQHKAYDSLTVFSVIVALYGLINFLDVSYFSPPWKYLTLASALVLLVFPHRPLALVCFAGFAIIEYLNYAPLFSNHLFIAFLLWIYVTVSWGYRVIKERTLDIDPERFYKLFAPGGRLALLTMYFFGVFHKINAPFLTPEFSCASTLMHYFVFVSADVEFPRIAYLSASYGTLVIETFIALMLMFPRTRYFAVVCGVAFHLLISFSMYRYYVPFTMLSIVMHALFLDAGMLERMRKGALGTLTTLTQSLMGRICLVMPLLIAFLFFAQGFDHENLAPSLMQWGLAAILILLLIVRYDRPGNTPSSEHYYLKSKLWPVNLLALLFFLSCFSPYFGFKTGHTINMFSNLHTENGHSNHYIFRRPIDLFDYQKDLVHVIESDDEGLQLFMHSDIRMVGHSFEAYMLEVPNAYVKYERAGEIREIHGMDDELKARFAKNWFERKFMLFTPVNISQPRNCMDLSDVARIRFTPSQERWFALEDTDS